tara:strand:+ start:4220 stop:4501 length:282 start_codon:yes stop_codon:yes gene_type:complete
MTKEDKLLLMYLRCEKLFDKIADAFKSQSGGQYNDTMYYQWLGASEELLEAQTENTIDAFEYAYKNLSKCWEYVEYCKKIDDLQQNMPDEIYC